ncbi:LOW QUALITY PROTEIN: WAP four-disulfide core domain protein 3-like [Phalacrocorax carbo]|uniref:LOW QUALITY PROTEIN: WAP four-disulfide core domain protein 3-like n=1 Tax=Phalacrocorax carbo TaxID=9209 RepID=UPI00311A4BB8
MSCHNDTMCSRGEKCCTLGCCARCVPAEPAKPGLCPRKRVQRSTAACHNRCTDDRDCPGDRKCCFSGCGLACAPPDRGSRRAIAKPGTCPMVLRGSLGPCLELCDTDSNCPGAAKCCTTGCGHVCKPPIKGKATEPCGSKTPMSPPCPIPADGDRAAECLLLCLQDKDCPPGQKCCLQGCGRACIPPLQARPACHSQQPGFSCPVTPGTPTRDFKPNPASAPDTHDIPSSTMRPGVFLLLALLALRAEPGTVPEEKGTLAVAIGQALLCQRERITRNPVPAQRLPPRGPYLCSFPCLEDKDCLGAQKCCLLGCGLACLEPVQDKTHHDMAVGPSVL